MAKVLWRYSDTVLTRTGRVRSCRFADAVVGRMRDETRQRLTRAALLGATQPVAGAELARRWHEDREQTMMFLANQTPQQRRLQAKLHAQWLQSRGKRISAREVKRRLLNLANEYHQREVAYAA